MDRLQYAHVWVKLVTSDYNSIYGVEPQIDSQGFGLHLTGGWVSGSTLADGQWHETVVNLTPGSNYFPSDVNGLQFELQPENDLTAASSAPPQATLLIDSIWIE